MTEAEVHAAVIVLIVVVLQLLLTVWVWRRRVYDRDQKVAQTRLIWFLPIFGAVLLLAFMPKEEEGPRRGNDTSA